MTDILKTCSTFLQKKLKISLIPKNLKNCWKKGLAGNPNPLARCTEKTMNSFSLGSGEISSGPGARVATSSIRPRNLLRRSLLSSVPSTQEPIQAPELAIGARFPVAR